MHILKNPHLFIVYRPGGNYQPKTLIIQQNLVSEEHKGIISIALLSNVLWKQKLQ